MKTINILDPKVKAVGMEGRKYVYKVNKLKGCYLLKGHNKNTGKFSFKETTCPSKKPKKRTIFVLQGTYGHGWEDLTAEETRSEIRQRLKEYRENEGGNYRIITRRE